MEDPNVFKIPPPLHPTSTFQMQNQAIVHDVIDIDNDENSNDVVIVGEKESKRNKGKAIAEAYNGYGDHQVVEVSDYTFCQSGVEKIGPVSGIEFSNGHPLVSHNLICADGHGCDLKCEDDNIGDIVSENVVDVDNYDLLEAHFYNVNIPPGIEAPLQEYDRDLKQTRNSHVMDSSQPSRSLEPTNSKTDNVGHSSGTEFAPQLFSQAAPSKKKSATSQQSGDDLNLSLGKESSKSKWSFKSFHSKMMSFISCASKNHGLVDKPEAMKLPNGAKKLAGGSSSSHSNFIGPDGSLHPPAGDGNNGTAVDEVGDEILSKFRNFKQFDIVEDASDHYFFSNNSSVKQNPHTWAKKIQDDWKILEKDLPDSIFVRVYESRMDLLRAVIIGAEGTPYHDGLFFFDVHFPSSYPSKPPDVHYHAGGLRLNPNLYACGKVCLSLLNTWSGSKKEKWLPGVSTMLQVLVSIQGLILNTKPYFNEPGYESSKGTPDGEKKSLKYNEQTFILSLKTMMYKIKQPPKNFEDFVLGHFRSRGHDILMACKAYMEGVQIGGVVKGGVQDVHEVKGSCSKKFKKSLPGHVNNLVKDLAKIGAKDCENFILIKAKK